MKNKKLKNKLNEKQLSQTSGGLGINDIKKTWSSVKKKANDFYNQAETNIKKALSRKDSYLDNASKKLNKYFGE